MNESTISDVAPFMAAAGVILFTLPISRQLDKATKKRYDKASSMQLMPEQIAGFATYLIEIYQAFTVTLLPLIGVLTALPHSKFSSLRVLAILAVALIGCLTAGIMLAGAETANPESYNRFSIKSITPAAYIGLVLNGVAAWYVWVNA